MPLIRYSILFLRVWPLWTIVFGCGANYEKIEPGTLTTIQVKFRGPEGSDQQTTCLYSVPNRYVPDETWPLVVALHGHGSNAAAFHDLWKSVTDSLGFVLLTPQGENRAAEGLGWGWGNGAERAIQIAIDIVRKAVNIDPARIYLTGFSSGGAITYMMGLKYPCGQERVT